MYGKDLYEDRVIVWLDRLYLLWVALSLGIPFLIGYFVGGGSWLLGLEALVWGGLFRIFLYQHATFSVNSICHMFGRKDYVSRDEARNNWIVALLVFGEGWHNNHHAFPASARHGLHRFQVDVVVGDPDDGARGSYGTSRRRRETSWLGAVCFERELTKRRSSSSTSSAQRSAFGSAMSFPTEIGAQCRGGRRE